MGRNISEELKSKILSESKRSGCVISELAKKYGIKVARIYRWRLKASREQSSLSNVNSKNFVEVKLSEKVTDPQPLRVLKKASLEFEDFKLSVEGSLEARRIQQILDLLC